MKNPNQLDASSFTLKYKHFMYCFSKEMTIATDRTLFARCVFKVYWLSMKDVNPKPLLHGIPMRTTVWQNQFSFQAITRNPIAASLVSTFFFMCKALLCRTQLWLNLVKGCQQLVLLKAGYKQITLCYNMGHNKIKCFWPCIVFNIT